MTPQRIASPAEPAFHRDGATLASYALLALLTLGYGMLGPLLPYLRDALSLTYREASYHSVAMALGVTGAGFIVPVVAARLGRKGCVAAALASIVIGLALISGASALPASLAGAAIVGMSVPLVVTVAPAVLTERHGPHTGIAMAEANAIAYIGFLLTPAIVSLVASMGDWRWSFVPPLLIYIVYWLALRPIDLGVMRFPAARSGGGTLTPSYWWHWLMLAFSISAELCMVVWGPSYLETVIGLPRDTALLASMAFPVGMLIGRIGVSVALRRFRSEELALAAMACGAMGALLFVQAAGLARAVGGLLITGVGMAGLYPFGITLAMQAAGAATDQGAARASLASGLATLIAPFIVGAVADRAGLQAAFGLVPMFLAVAAAAHIAGRRAAR